MDWVLRFRSSTSDQICRGSGMYFGLYVGLDHLTQMLKVLGKDENRDGTHVVKVLDG